MTIGTSTGLVGNYRTIWMRSFSVYTFVEYC